ncbi:GNAT family N-acetyltransferase [Patescibacteria group bacterium]|nr:GNAT family N-acetyltransferase [Patescibacteria group bacterium]MCG2702183.1 GNAT family N-acetyltransferase [Candidatus Parcubacteria bacterium]MBU4265333.1 GNAT family N-acetyltransferase [Patescibacteria group bacterium]MBU4390773.1 GNAT family N-acetyltransferase [Patescibacteria group bacterium]MBU4397200.1 GNAT family N-acetyltransferase [Patescibacteria group bacterium]
MKNKTKILFITPIKEVITNHKTNEECFLVSNENGSKFTKADLTKITQICNQPLVYNFLFKYKFKGRSYRINDAKKFIEWIVEGWTKQKWFVFFIRNSQNEIIGAIDIKSNNLELTEVGYWADYNHSGIITNATQTLIKLAKRVGYKKLYATTMPNNSRSQNVLTRNGFIRDGEMQKPSGMRFKFIRNLSHRS